MGLNKLLSITRTTRITQKISAIELASAVERNFFWEVANFFLKYLLKNGGRLSMTDLRAWRILGKEAVNNNCLIFKFLWRLKVELIRFRSVWLTRLKYSGLSATNMLNKD